MLISIVNAHVKASFAAKGAELQSLVHKQFGINYLWNGDPAYWAKHSPILFPIVGALKNDSYEFEGKTYQLPRHGFARDLDFDYEKIGQDEIRFTLTQSEETLKVYPFEFKLTVTYKLKGCGLACTYEVVNPAAKPLLFSIGAHPAFTVPLNEQGNYEDYFLQFNKDEQITYHHIEENLISPNTSTVPLNNGELGLTHALFYEDALVFKGLKSDCVSLINHKNYNGINFDFKEFPYFGIWAAKDANFVCLEPWCGIADAVDHDQQLMHKEGIVTLAPQEKWKRCWQVTCF